MSTRRMCEVCKTRPPAMREIPCCFECWPGGPVPSPPCRKCGSTRDYYTSGLCARCHTHAPGQKSPAAILARGPDTVVDSCPDCLGWGATRTYGWLCAACRGWREDHPTIAGCSSCRRSLAVDGQGYCRLCRKHRSYLAHQLGIRPSKITIEDANQPGQQLFLVGLFHRQGQGKTPYRKKSTPPDMSLLRPVTHEQVVLFDAVRDLQAARRRGFPPPPDPALEAAFHRFVREHAAAFHWPEHRAEMVHKAIRILLALQDTPGAAIRRSDVALLSRIDLSAAVVADVLAQAGMLHEDRLAPIERWFPLQINALPAPMRAELTAWFDTMRHGSATAPRRLPRSDQVTSNHLRWALPTLTTWAATHPSLREITRETVRAALPQAGPTRTTTLQALRSIFSVLKARNLVFTNPTTHMSAPKPFPSPPASIDLDDLRAAIDSDNPAEALITCLLAFHAVRIRHTATIQLTDVHDGRLQIGDQIIALANPVRTRMTAYLNHRHATWPDTINPHLFIHTRNQFTNRPVTSWWIRHQLSIAPQHIRIDRIFDEAIASGGDARALCDLFGLTIAGARRYTILLERAADLHNPPAHP